MLSERVCAGSFHILKSTRGGRTLNETRAVQPATDVVWAATATPHPPSTHARAIIVFILSSFMMLQCNRCVASAAVSNRTASGRCDDPSRRVLSGTAIAALSQYRFRMAIEVEGGDGLHARRAWMIEEFRHAQQRRRATRLASAVEPVRPGGANSDAPTDGDPRDVVIIRS
jgi:hypothetical protein